MCLYAYCIVMYRDTLRCCLTCCTRVLKITLKLTCSRDPCVCRKNSMPSHSIRNTERERECSSLSSQHTLIKQITHNHISLLHWTVESYHGKFLSQKIDLTKNERNYLEINRNMNDDEFGRNILHTWNGWWRKKKIFQACWAFR